MRGTSAALITWTSNLKVVNWDRKLGHFSPAHSCIAPTSYTFSKNCQELTVMEFMKPKLGPMENLFLISGQRHWEPQPSMPGVGAVPRSQFGAHTA